MENNKDEKVKLLRWLFPLALFLFNGNNRRANIDAGGGYGRKVVNYTPNVRLLEVCNIKFIINADILMDYFILKVLQRSLQA